MPDGLNAEPGADAALPGVCGADALPHVWLGWPVCDGPRCVVVVDVEVVDDGMVEEELVVCEFIIGLLLIEPPPIDPPCAACADNVNGNNEKPATVITSTVDLIGMTSFECTDNERSRLPFIPLHAIARNIRVKNTATALHTP